VFNIRLNNAIGLDHVLSKVTRGASHHRRRPPSGCGIWNAVKVYIGPLWSFITCKHCFTWRHWPGSDSRGTVL